MQAGPFANAQKHEAGGGAQTVPRTSHHDVPDVGFVSGTDEALGAALVERAQEPPLVSKRVRPPLVVPIDEDLCEPQLGSGTASNADGW